jgi:hypothetical protein
MTPRSLSKEARHDFDIDLGGIVNDPEILLFPLHVYPLVLHASEFISALV